MALWDSSSSSSSKTSANTVGGQSTSGPVSPVHVSGEGGSHTVVIDQSQTDFDAINAGKDVAGRSLDSIDYAVDKALGTSGDVFRDMLNFGGNIVTGAGNLISDVIKQSTFQQEQAMLAAQAAFADASKTTGIAIDSNTLISQDSIELARDVVGLTGELNQQNIDYMTSGFNTVNNTVEAMTDSLQASDAVQAQMNSEQLGAITELATAVQTGGESINANVNKMIAVVAVLGIGLVAWRMAGQS
ncbi:hypothetical protein GCM10011403_29380 [Pseudohongiella nitratireducens]|uniref:Uncharacterized protein n=1 Tax=Pseudohongiella nitratireducens TaxID=1768907 RepID=A0A916QMG8_9GAMM|nr:hypothetical protein [Pseudohongiella nitratireducens]GFZ83911.1 hypothetical protein GCM10011403_29380 [Pseudohongiella nitratireducens]